MTCETAGETFGKGKLMLSADVINFFSFNGTFPTAINLCFNGINSRFSFCFWRHYCCFFLYAKKSLYSPECWLPFACF